MVWINSKLKNPYVQGLIFLSILIGLFFFLGYHKIFFSKPFGVHFMRQTDSLSFASNYFNNGFHFFKPQLYNLKNIDGMAACEFPLSYYISAILYVFFGKHIVIQKLLHLIIIYFGVYSIFKLCNYILKDFAYSILISLIVFTSTVFNYYSFNYLPDIPALGFIFMGWFFIYKYQINSKIPTLILSFLFFTLGSLIKVTYLINPIAVLVLSGFSLIFYRKNSLLTNSKRILIIGVISLLPVILWNIYVLQFNDLYNSHSFNTKAFPIWKLNHEKITIIWDYVTNYWYNTYFSKSVFRLIYAFALFQLIYSKKSDKKILIQVLILFLGSLAYFVLFYRQFKDHDYYFLAFFPLILLILINGIKTLQNVTQKNGFHIVVKIILLAVIVAGINHSKNKIEKRQVYKVDNYSRAGLLINENYESIKKLNIDSKAKFIVAPDLCQNGGLFFLDRSGWNIEKSHQITLEKIKEYKNQGANYLLLVSSDESIILLGEQLGELILRENEINIFKLNKDNVSNNPQ
jgi:hypothetical protein